MFTMKTLLVALLVGEYQSQSRYSHHHSVSLRTRVYLRVRGEVCKRVYLFSVTNTFQILLKNIVGINKHKEGI